MKTDSIRPNASSGVNPSHSSPRSLVRAALAGAAGPRVATGPLAVHYCARLAGVSLQQYTRSAQVLADCVIRYYERFCPDAVWLSADTWVSAEAMGATVASLGEDEPLGGTGIPFIREAGDIDRIPPPDPGSQGRYPLMLEALDRLVKALGHSAFIVACFDQYPFSLAAALMGLEALLLKCRDDRSMVEALMNRCLAYGLAYGRALGALGADLLSGGDSPAGLVGPAAYREVAWPFEQRLVAGLKATTEKPVSLHICGNATPILGTMASTGADVLEIDHRVDLAQACQAVGSEVALWGNLDPVGLLAQGTPAQVRELTRRALDAVRGCGHWRFVLSSGCTLAPDTPPENLDAMFRMADEYEWPAP